MNVFWRKCQVARETQWLDYIITHVKESKKKESTFLLIRYAGLSHDKAARLIASAYADRSVPQLKLILTASVFRPNANYQPENWERNTSVCNNNNIKKKKNECFIEFFFYFFQSLLLIRKLGVRPVSRIPQQKPCFREPVRESRLLWELKNIPLPASCFFF